MDECYALGFYLGLIRIDRGRGSNYYRLPNRAYLLFMLSYFGS